MVKLFIGNLPTEATAPELRSLFEQFGKVTECDIITNYGFVHMEDKKSADEAVHNLNHYKLHGVSINVEHSRGKPKASTKLHVSSLSTDITSDELRAKFEEYGSVLECDIVKDYAFVHMEKADEALEAIRNLNNFEFKGETYNGGLGLLVLDQMGVSFGSESSNGSPQCRTKWALVINGKKMHVQLSTSRLRVTPGMGERSRCYRCGKDGHWSGVCPLDQMAQEMELAPPFDPFGDPYDPMRNAAAAAYAERLYYDDRERNLIDYYQRYRVRPTSYDAYMDRRLPPMPPPPMSAITHRKRMESYPYERHLLPPPPPMPNYYTRERSPLRRSPASTAVDGFMSERRVTPASRYIREPYGDRARYF